LLLGRGAATKQEAPIAASSYTRTLDKSPSKTCVDRDDSGRLEPEVIQQVVKQRYDLLRKCYEAALGRSPIATGKVTTRFAIMANGKVKNAQIVSNTIPDCVAVRCMREVFRSMVFPQPWGGNVTVVYPIQFEPG
jgi:hypothetical protein